MNNLYNEKIMFASKIKFIFNIKLYLKNVSK